MSTALEAIAAREAGMEVLGFSLITNLAAGLGEPLSHAEVIDAGKEAEPVMSALLANVVAATRQAVAVVDTKTDGQTKLIEAIQRSVDRIAARDDVTFTAQLANVVAALAKG